MTRRWRAQRGASTSEFVLVLGLVALFLIAGLGAFGDSLGKLIDARAECVETWQCTQGKPLAPPPAAVVTPPPAAEKSWLDNALAIGGDFAKGFIVDGLGGTVQSAWSLVTDPVGTVSNIVGGVAAVVQNPGAAWEQVKSDFSENPARFLGSLASGLVGGPAGGLGKVGKLAKAADELADAGAAIPPVARRREPENRGSTADPNKQRYLPNTYREHLAVEEAMRSPEKGTTLPLKLGDSRWPAKDGWVKKQRIFDPGGREGPINVHYVYNERTGQIDDFKIVQPERAYRPPPDPKSPTGVNPP